MSYKHLFILSFSAMAVLIPLNGFSQGAQTGPNARAPQERTLIVSPRTPAPYGGSVSIEPPAGGGLSTRDCLNRGGCPSLPAPAVIQIRDSSEVYEPCPPPVVKPAPKKSAKKRTAIRSKSKRKRVVSRKPVKRRAARTVALTQRARQIEPPPWNIMVPGLQPPILYAKPGTPVPGQPLWPIRGAAGNIN